MHIVVNNCTYNVRRTGYHTVEEHLLLSNLPKQKNKENVSNCVWFTIYSLHMQCNTKAVRVYATMQTLTRETRLNHEYLNQDRND